MAQEYIEKPHAKEEDGFLKKIWEALTGVLTISGSVTTDVDTSTLATSAKQLPDNHQVTVSNPTADPETGLAKDATLTNGTQKIQIVDSGGEAVSVTDGKLDVNSSAPVGGATADKQDTLFAEVAKKTEPTDSQLSELILAIKNLVVSIANPSYVDKSANQMRAQVTGAVTVASTTLTNITFIDSIQARLLMMNENQNAWSNSVRRLIS